MNMHVGLPDDPFAGGPAPMQTGVTGEAWRSEGPVADVEAW